MDAPRTKRIGKKGGVRMTAPPGRELPGRKSGGGARKSSLSSAGGQALHHWCEPSTLAWLHRSSLDVALLGGAAGLASSLIDTPLFLLKAGGGAQVAVQSVQASLTLHDAGLY